jgi:hypothetical protein
MEHLRNRLNEEYYTEFSYAIFLNFHNKKADTDKLESYLTKQSNNIYTMTGNGRLYALVDIREETKNKLHNKIVNYLSNVVGKPRVSYHLRVINSEDLENGQYEPFDYWLSYAMFRIEYSGKKWDFQFRMKYDNDDDFVNLLYNKRYVDDYRQSNTNTLIYEDMDNTYYKNCHKHITKNLKNDLIRLIFVKKLKNNFTFTRNKTDYLSKKIVCDLMDLDCNSKKDIRYLNDVLIDYGVEYDRQKYMNKSKGVFFGISLK